jgi:hypothetical protein
MNSKSKNNNDGVMFSKVFRSALESRYPEFAVDNLLKVAYATPNAEVAVEMLLNIYEYPELETHVVSSTSGTKYTLVSYDMFAKIVSYTYEDNKKLHIYVDADVDRDLVNYDNYLSYKQEYSNAKNLRSVNVILPEMEKHHSTMELSHWQTFVKWVQPVVTDELEYQLAD